MLIIQWQNRKERTAIDKFEVYDEMLMEQTLITLD